MCCCDMQLGYRHTTAPLCSCEQMEDSVEEQRHVAAMKGGSYRFFLRGKSSVPVEDDFKVLQSTSLSLLWTPAASRCRYSLISCVVGFFMCQVESGSKAKLKPYEKCLKKFQYQNALTAALEVCYCYFTLLLQRVFAVVVLVRV